MTDRQVDIKENEIFELSPELLNALLKDHTLSNDTELVNIFWATDSYAHLGAGYRYADKITVEAITGANGNVIVPRAVKSRQIETPAVYSISHLEAMWDIFHQQKIDLQKLAINKTDKLVFLYFFTLGAGAISSAAFACGWNDSLKVLFIFLTLIGMVVMLYSFLKSKNYTSLEDKGRYMEEFQEKYICHIPEQRKRLGCCSYKLMKRQY